MYEGYWSRWDSFLTEKQTKYNDQHSITLILQFLQSLVDQGLGYNSVNSARSALSLILPPVENQTIGNHQLVTRFLKGVSRLKPPKPKYDYVWDPSDILSYIDSMGDNSTLDLKKLTLKLVSLLMLTTGHRVQTIHCIQLSYICFISSGIRIIIPDIIKTSKPSTLQPSFNLDYYTPNPNICVVTTLKYYLDMTKSLRTTQKLFVIITKPYKEASKDTLARWLKLMLSLSNIDKSFTAHSYRHASTSKAKNLGVNIDVIFKNAGWSNRSQMFAKFYDKPIINSNSFSSSILACHTK